MPLPLFRQRLARNVLAALLSPMGLCCSVLAASGFVDQFAPNRFSLANTNADGFVDTAAAPLGSVVLTGGNNDSFAQGITTWISLPIISASTLSFSWTYSGDDFPYDGLVGDRAGYYVNNTFTSLAAQGGDYGSLASLSLNQGSTFGFFVETADNIGVPGTLSIHSFDFHAAPVEAVPGPSGILGIWPFWAAMRMLKKRTAAATAAARPCP